jgi:hypothetical protein
MQNLRIDVHQDLLYLLFLVDAGDDLRGAAASRAALYVDKMN